MDNEKIIKDAQYRKGLSIAYFNSLNSAIELAKVMFPDMPGVDVKVFITEWRDYFLEEHKNYYAKVIANVGSNFNIEEGKEKLEKTNNLEELQLAWVLLSEDERRHKDIRKLAIELRKKYEKA